MQVKNKLGTNFKGTSISLYTVVLVEVILPNPVLKKSSDGMKVVSWNPLTIAYQVHSIISLQVIKKESTRRSSNKWKTTLYRDYSHRIANLCTTVSISSQRKLFLTTPNVQNRFWSSYETLEITGGMKLLLTCYLCLHNFSELWNLFSYVSMGNCFRCYFRQLFIPQAFRKCKKDCNILTNILEEGFCPIKTEIGQFPLGFCLNYYWRTNYRLDLNKDILFYA